MIGWQRRPWSSVGGSRPAASTGRAGSPWPYPPPAVPAFVEPPSRFPTVGAEIRDDALIPQPPRSIDPTDSDFLLSRAAFLRLVGE